MTDSELLESAAKAHGGLARIGGSPDGNFFSDQPGVMRRWNPLEDDGDALRLAVILGIRIDPPTNGGDAEATTKDEWFMESCGPDSYAATRRAIVRAAAALCGVQR